MDPSRNLKCADFFCGIGGFHLAAKGLGLQVVTACDIDKEARRAYAANYGLEPLSDITELAIEDVPDFDLLFAGFPCQPFSIIGNKKGFADPRGNLIFHLLRFVAGKRPAALLLENVKQLYTMQQGQVLKTILDALVDLGYDVQCRVLNALDFGLPQKRERTIIVAAQESLDGFEWPAKALPMLPLSLLLEEDPDPRHFVSDYIRVKRRNAHSSAVSPSIWHENKAGNISSHAWSCALRAGASHNYLLVDGVRRLTPREQLQLQGFPAAWEIVCSDAQTRKQAGNAVPVPMIQSVLERLILEIMPDSLAVK